MTKQYRVKVKRLYLTSVTRNITKELTNLVPTELHLPQQMLIPIYTLALKEQSLAIGYHLVYTIYYLNYQISLPLTV